MLSYLFEKTTSVVSGAYDLVADTTNYLVDDIASIPDAIEKGWENPSLYSSEYEEKLEEVVEKTTTRKFGNK